MATMQVEGGRLSTRSKDPIQVLYGSCNGESSGLSLLFVAYVSHELHARKILDETGSEPSSTLFSPARSSLTSRIPKYYTPLVKPIHGLISAFFPWGGFSGQAGPIH